MPLLQTRSFSSTVLELPEAEGDLQRWNHVLEPEYHQELYVAACEQARKSPGAFQLGDLKIVKKYPYRGLQPIYADDEEVAETLEYEGMILPDGSVLTDEAEIMNICALKSVSVRWGYVDFDVARSVSREFYNLRKKRCSVEAGDLLINSTGDGTIGRVAVFNRNMPAIVDGHITIVRFFDLELAWYVAAYLLSAQGQRQIYRYINGSSGQVEIYPQDIARLWIPRKTNKKVNDIALRMKAAAEKHDAFYRDMRLALSLINS